MSGHDDSLDREYAEATSRLVNILLPDAQEVERLRAKAAMATIARCTVLQALQRVDVDKRIKDMDL